MGQTANNGGRRASLDESKGRSAGRRKDAVRRQIRDASEEQFARGKTAGASGSRARGAVGGQGSGGSGGGGGGAATSSKSGYQSVGRSTKSARKRGT